MTPLIPLAVAWALARGRPGFTPGRWCPTWLNSQAAVHEGLAFAQLSVEFLVQKLPFLSPSGEDRFRHQAVSVFVHVHAIIGHRVIGLRLASFCQ